MKANDEKLTVADLKLTDEVIRELYFLQNGTNEKGQVNPNSGIHETLLDFTRINLFLIKLLLLNDEYEVETRKTIDCLFVVRQTLFSLSALTEDKYSFEENATDES